MNEKKRRKAPTEPREPRADIHVVFPLALLNDLDKVAPPRERNTYIVEAAREKLAREAKRREASA